MDSRHWIGTFQVIVTKSPYLGLVMKSESTPSADDVITTSRKCSGEDSELSLFCQTCSIKLVLPLSGYVII